MTKPQSAAARLRRILVLVPWVMARKGATVDEVCARFGLTRDELLADLELIFLCGLPPFGPGDLIDAYVDGDEVVIGMADYLARPPRLTRGEAMSLLVMGRAIAALPGLEEAGALSSALAKLSKAIAPGEVEAADAVEVDLAAGAELVVALRRAIADRSTQRISYYSAGRGEMSEREIDPWLIFAANGAWYVGAFDHQSNEERTFRLDRIRSLEATGARFEPPPPSQLATHAAIFTPSAHDMVAVVEVDGRARWLRDAIPSATVTELPKGRARLEIRTTHLAWLVRLLLTAGPDARPIEPPQLVDEVRATAWRALKLYAGRGTASDG